MIPEPACDNSAANEITESDAVTQELLFFWGKMNETQREALLAFIRAFLR